MTAPDQNFWKRKLLALLHDPPEKALDVPGHVERRRSHVIRAFGGQEDFSWFFDRICDHTAAAADRFCFPQYPRGAAGFDPAKGAPFHHPLGADDTKLGRLVFEGGCPTADRASEMLARAQERLGLEGRSDHEKFWLHWRFWQEEVSEGIGSDRHPAMAFLPADTRIPDHTIWTHAAVTSALQGCVEIEESAEGTKCKEFRPAFLLMQFGPVQEFISQARSTRDLWSGSYLLSWIVAHAIKAVTDRIGPDAILFPALCGQPLFDFLHAEFYKGLGREVRKMHGDAQILIPNLPNRFLAVVPESLASELAGAAEKTARSCLFDKVGDACWNWLAEKHPHRSPGDEARQRWEQQLRQFLSVTWQIGPWRTREVEETMKRFAQLPAGKAVAEGAACSPAEALQRAHAAAIGGIPDESKDARNYRHKSWQAAGVWKSEMITDAAGRAIIDNPAFAWAAHFAETDFLLAARRNLRDFEQWGEGVGGAESDFSSRHAVKDAFSGKEEVIGSEDWQKALPQIQGARIFREGDRLGAMNLIKRVWHEAVLRPLGLERLPRFDSVPAVAAAHWVCENHEVIARDVADLLDQDNALFHLSEWDRMEDIEEKKRTEGKGRLRALHKTCRSVPSRYVAVLAMDGDSMGSWVSGAMSPPWKTQLSSWTLEDFFANSEIGGQDIRSRLLEAPRHVSPSYHLQFSEALANFSIYLAGVIVESFDGQLIYSGGDDVLAMLPARQALPCALALRKAFRGERDLAEHFSGCESLTDAHEGFVALDGGSWFFRRTKRFLPRGVPLLVPGTRTDISAGIALGHMHTPLQNLVQAAHHALDRAKTSPGKAAFAMSLHKRSGESIEWGARWDSAAIDLSNQFRKHSEEGHLSQKFPYALAALLQPYATSVPGKEWQILPSGGFDPSEVFPLEIKHALDRQSDPAWRKSSESSEFEKLTLAYLENCSSHPLMDFLGPFLATAFIHRNAE